MKNPTYYLLFSLEIITFSVCLNTNLQAGAFATANPYEGKINNLEIYPLREKNQPQLDINEANSIVSAPDTPDGKIFIRLMEKAIANDLDRAKMSTIIQEIATNFLGTPYEAGLLDRTSQETLVISLQKFDCLLFVETILALARTITERSYSYDEFSSHVSRQRYFQGKMTDYCSRLHYFSHWIFDNQQRDLVTNITADLGGVTIIKKLNFMTGNRHKYTQLIKDDNYNCIAQTEKSLEQLSFNYIPTHKIEQIYSKLQPGDIIGIATKIEGLDFTHTGLVYRDRVGNTGLIHASPAGRVVIARDLQAYVQNVPQAVGIVVTRPH